jgi:hypothetical protein
MQGFIFCVSLAIVFGGLASNIWYERFLHWMPMWTTHGSDLLSIYAKKILLLKKYELWTFQGVHSYWQFSKTSSYKEGIPHLLLHAVIISKPTNFKTYKAYKMMKPYQTL